MLTVLTNNVRQQHEREGRGANNRPELRQKLIIELVQKQFTEFQIIYSSKTISIPWLANIHDIDYLNFLEDAYNELFKIKDTDWMDSTGGLVPNHFFKTKPNKNVPIYKLSGYYGSDCISPIYKDTYQNSMIAAQQAYTAAQILSDSDSSNIVYVLACSPGHHAKTNEYGGYCYINNAVVAAYRLTELGHNKVAILDLDFHASNGCAEMINNNPKLKNKLYLCSIHCDPIVDYPSYEGYEDDYDNDAIVNFPMNPHTTWEEYQEVLENTCTIIKKWGVDALLIAFGADTYCEDPDASPLGRFQLKLQDYDKMGRIIRENFDDLPMIITQEGGYDMENVPEIVCRFLSNLLPGA